MQERCISLITMLQDHELLIIHVYMDFMSPLVFFNLKEQQIQLCSDIDMQMKVFLAICCSSSNHSAIGT